MELNVYYHTRKFFPVKLMKAKSSLLFLVVQPFRFSGFSGHSFSLFPVLSILARAIVL